LNAVIVEGVLARAIAGNALNSDAFKTGVTGIALANQGWALARP
jgi:hypothetical protein